MIPDLISELNEYQEYEVLNMAIVSDGEGGQRTVWTPGLKFMAAVTMDDTTEMLIAQSQGVKGNYSVTTHKATRLPYHTVFRRVSDHDAIYRIVSKDEFAPPATSSLDIRGNRAEEFVLPSEVDEDDGE